MLLDAAQAPLAGPAVIFPTLQ